MRLLVLVLGGVCLGHHRITHAYTRVRDLRDVRLQWATAEHRGGRRESTSFPHMAMGSADSHAAAAAAAAACAATAAAVVAVLASRTCGAVPRARLVAVVAVVAVAVAVCRATAAVP